MRLADVLAGHWGPIWSNIDERSADCECGQHFPADGQSVVRAWAEHVEALLTAEIVAAYGPPF